MEPLNILFAVAIVFISFALRLKLGDNMIEGPIGYPYLIFVLVGCGIFRKILDGYVSRFIQVGSWADVGEVVAWILGIGMGIGLAVSAAKLADVVGRSQSEFEMQGQTPLNDLREDPDKQVLPLLKKIECEECGLTFKTLTDRARHIKDHHSGN